MTISAAFVLMTFGAAANAVESSSDTVLEPESRHENIGELVTTFIQKSHYNHVSVNDELSSAVMDTFIDELDRNKVYLLASDIEFFEKYRYELDDLVRNKPLDPVFDMSEIWRTRVRERFEFALEQLEEHLEETQSDTILLKADKGLPLETWMRIVDACQMQEKRVIALGEAPEDAAQTSASPKRSSETDTLDDVGKP